MKEKQFIYRIAVVILIGTASFKCEAQYVPYDWSASWGVMCNYSIAHNVDFSAFLGGEYYNSRVGFGLFGKKITPVSSSVADSAISHMAIVNGDTVRGYTYFSHDTTITNHPIGYLYYEPGLKLGKYVTVACKMGMWFAYSRTEIGSIPGYTYTDTIITTESGSGSSSSSSNTNSRTIPGTKGSSETGLGVGFMVCPNVSFHFQWPSNRCHTVLNVGYDIFFRPFGNRYYFKDAFLDKSKGLNGLSIGMGLEFPL